MLSALRLWTPLGLMVLGATDSYGSVVHKPYPYYNISTSCSTTTSELQSTTVVSYETTTTSQNCSTSETTISSSSEVYSSYNTTILTTTSTLSTSCNTTVVPTTISTSTITLPTFTPPTFTPPTLTTPTITLPTYTPPTITPPTITPPTSVYEPCPTTCSISAGTVNLFFWPTDNTYTYPATYVDEALDYTFTSPSVYMVINTIFGYNSLGRTGPSASSPVFALDLDQVSTIAPDGATLQLTLNDLGTDCPQSEDPSVIATMSPDGRCDPSLVAPDVVKSWALPCNACGRFGLFDPPYAIPALTGGLVPTTVITTPVEETTTAPATTPAATGATSTTVVETTTTPAAGTTTPASTETPTVITSSSTTIPSSAGTVPTTVVTAPAARVTAGLACMMFSILISISLV
ncbi:hypothetical protein GGR54DRAFT_475754 [Hypoxylon sp. NC1633]|nr:hypothetical protein GGR54DRAFT_475754 [Hypoxylon sp. NC1633]